MATGEPGKTEEQYQEIALRAMELRLSGLSYSKIAAKLVREGLLTTCSDTLAHQYVNREATKRNRELNETSAEMRRVELERLDRILEGIWERCEAGSLDHIETYLKVANRRSKLAGLDAPTKSEAVVKDERRSMTDAQLYERMRKLQNRVYELTGKRHPMLDERNPYQPDIEVEVIRTDEG